MKIEKLKRWSEECDAHLAEACGADRDDIAHAVDAGALECYRLFDGEAYMVTRYEPAPNRLTVCCYQGARLKDFAAWFLPTCIRRGIGEIRFHAASPAIARVLAPLPFQLTEYVYTLPLAGLEADSYGGTA